MELLDEQIKVVKDSIEYGLKGVVSLWAFGLMY